MFRVLCLYGRTRDHPFHGFEFYAILSSATALIKLNPAREGGIVVSIYTLLLELLISVIGSILGALIVQVLVQ